MYRKGAKPRDRDLSTINVGVEVAFYGEPGPGSLDDQLTELETNEYSGLVRELRALPATQPVQDDRIPSLVSHLVLRTRALRCSMEDVVDGSMTELYRHFGDPETIRSLVQNDRLLREVVREQLAEHGIDPARQEEVLAVIKAYLPTAIDSIIPEIKQAIDTNVGMARSMMPHVCRDSHIQALSKSPRGDERAQAYRDLHWSLVLVKAPLVLGDTACVFETTGDRRFKPLNIGEDELHGVFLPVAADRVLLGTRSPMPAPVDPHLLNKAAVGCSYEFFISSVQLPTTSPLPASIGLWSGILNAAEIAALIGQIKAEWS